MGKYDFNKIIDRSNTSCWKWDLRNNENELPMWIADMDLPTAPCVVEALKRRVNHPIYGYTYPSDKWYQAWINFYKERHNFNIEKDWLIFSTGVIPTISSTIRKLTTPNEGIVVLTPIYNTFFNSIINNGRRPIESKLIYKDGTYSIDWKDLEDKLSDSQTMMLIFCNPHNPIGKIWSKEEIIRIGELCKKYNVLVISDEIHCELTAPNKSYTPFASVNSINKEISITAVAPSKAFNMAGLNSSAIIVPNPYLKAKVERQLNTDECAEPNVFACDVAIAALNEGRDYLDELRIHIQNNREFVEKFIKEKIPEIEVTKQDSTYLLWLNISKISDDSDDFTSFIRKETGLWLASGSIYRGDGKSFVRMNVACPTSLVEDRLNRLLQAVTLYKNKQ